MTISYQLRNRNSASAALPDQATAFEITDAIGESTDDEMYSSGSEFDTHEEIIDDGNEFEGPRRNRNGESRNRNQNEFINSDAPIDIEEIDVLFKLSETNLPGSFNAQTNPLDYFDLFFTDAMFDEMLFCINQSWLEEQIRITRSQMDLLSSDSNFNMVFNSITKNELKSFFGMTILYGIMSITA